MKDIRLGLYIPTMLLTHSTGNNCGNSHFLWQVSDESLEEAVRNSQGAIEEVKSKLPVFHSRQMKREFVNKFGRISLAV